MVRPALVDKSPAEWDDWAKNLGWRLRVPQSIDDLHETIKAQKPFIDEFRRLVLGYANYRNDAERKMYKGRLEQLAKEPGFEREDYQVTIAEIIRKDLNGLKGEDLTAIYLIPKKLGVSTKVSGVETIAALKSNVANGRQKAQLCIICHKIDQNGVNFGPQLTHWGQSRTIEQIVKDIVDPGAQLARG